MSDKRDLTGQLYMRNRCYDPKSGRFTQEDPIGIAGGLNVYGFANGDPVTYSDPYGLWPDPIDWPVLPQGVVDFAAGFGDGASGGLARLARGLWGDNDVVNTSSRIYGAAELGGSVARAATTRAGPVRTQASRCGTTYPCE